MGKTARQRQNEARERIARAVYSVPQAPISEIIAAYNEWAMIMEMIGQAAWAATIDKVIAGYERIRDERI